jgi:hypothetical protein
MTRRRASFEVALFPNREAMSAHSLGRKPKESPTEGLSAAKRWQQIKQNASLSPLRGCGFEWAQKPWAHAQG